MMLMLNVPASIGLIVLAGPIIELLVEYGNITATDTVGMAAALMGYAPGLVGYSAVKIASPTFYALRESRTPVTIGMICIVLNVALNLLLVRTSLSYAGLALGTGIAALANAAAALLDAAASARRPRRSPPDHGAAEGAGGVGGDGGGRLGRRAPAVAALGRPRTVAPRRPGRARHQPGTRARWPSPPGSCGCTSSRSPSGASGAASPAAWPAAAADSGPRAFAIPRQGGTMPAVRGLGVVRRVHPRPRRPDAGGQGPADRDDRGLRRAVHRRVRPPSRYYGNVNGPLIVWLGMTPALVLRAIVWQPRHLPVPARRFHAPDLQHAGAVDVRRRSRTPLGPDGVPPLLLRLRHRRRPDLPRSSGCCRWLSTRAVYVIPTIGASGAIYGLLLAYAILFPNRIIYYFIFPIPVRIYVLLAGLLVLYESARGGRRRSRTSPTSAG